ncbi:hypothetical protein BDC45DRAFT_574857 [Circinella umbellata]|nr:hypothetical protein BDC45DRAFT_574857 [Circinella umbellata]
MASVEPVLQNLLLIPVSYDTVKKAIFKLSFSINPPRLSSSIIFASILEHIWKSHWNFIFKNVPFVIQNTITHIHSHLLQILIPDLIYESTNTAHQMALVVPSQQDVPLMGVYYDLLSDVRCCNCDLPDGLGGTVPTRCPSHG